MLVAFACYEHTCIGFPHIKLKWSEEGSPMRWNTPYYTIHGVIQSSWEFSSQSPNNALNREYECHLFDEWVRKTFSNDPTVQG